MSGTFRPPPLNASEEEQQQYMREFRAALQECMAQKDREEVQKLQQKWAEKEREKDGLKNSVMDPATKEHLVDAIMKDQTAIMEAIRFQSSTDWNKVVDDYLYSILK